MNRKERYEQAALRHFFDAELLAERERYDGAGHFVGLSAECAIKHAVTSLRASSGAPHAHLPDLVEIAKKHLRGARAAGIRQVLGVAHYFADWAIDGRYAGDGAVQRARYEAWRADAQRTLAAAGLRGGTRG